MLQDLQIIWSKFITGRYFKHHTLSDAFYMYYSNILENVLKIKIMQMHIFTEVCNKP